MIQKHNQINKGHKLAINQFADMNQSEMVRMQNDVGDIESMIRELRMNGIKRLLTANTTTNATKNATTNTTSNTISNSTSNSSSNSTTN